MTSKANCGIIRAWQTETTIQRKTKWATTQSKTQWILQNQKGELCQGELLQDFKECDMPTAEETRQSNPPCNLRGTGWNRWEWLCKNPQKHIFWNQFSSSLKSKESLKK